ncbi:MAG: porin [Tabrizicola sp.]
MKYLLASTAIVIATAGMASAEIALSGSARMGMVYSDDGTNSATQFSSRVRIVFTGSGETNTGLSFGASMRADQDGGNGNGKENRDSTVYISGAFGKLTMGDVSGAADALVGQVSGVGYGPNDALQEINFLGTVKTAVYYEYSTGALTFGVGTAQAKSTAEQKSIAVKYATDMFSVALGYETTNADFVFVPVAEDLISASASVKLGDATVKARVADTDVSGTDTAWAVSVDYSLGATTLTAFYTDYGNNTARRNSGFRTGSTDTQHVGIGVAYDLGGGATFAGGIVQQNNTGVDDQTFADVGLKFSF